MLVSQLETVSKVKAVFRKPSLPFGVAEMKADGAAIAPAGFLIRDLRRSGWMSWSGSFLKDQFSSVLEMSLSLPTQRAPMGPKGRCTAE